MPIDTVNDLPPRVQYTAAAAQTVFAYPFPIFADGDLVVDVDGATQALNTDYTVSGEGEDAGGNVTFLSAMAGNEVVTIYRDLAIERTSDFQTNGPLSSATFNDELDRITLVQQQLQDGINRSLRLPVITTGLTADTELTADNWAGMYMSFDANGIPTPAALTSTALTQAILGALLNPRTGDEITASVTPTDYSRWADPILDGERYGFVGDNATLNNTAMAKAIAVCTVNNGGILMLKPGTYLFSAGFELPESMQIWGSGMLSTTLKANGAFTLCLLGSADSSRNVLRDLTLQGTSKTGTGIQIGDTSFSGQHKFDNVRVTAFATGVRLAGALWSKFISCLIDYNDIGVDYYAGWASGYSNAIDFYASVVASNDKSGIAATYTPVRNIGFTYIGGSVEQNGSEAPATYPQIVLGALAHFQIKTYIEYAASAPRPDGINVSSASNGEIAGTYFSGTGTGVISSSAGSSLIYIHHCDFNATTTKCIDMPSCTQVTAFHNEYDTTNTIDGSNSSDVVGAMVGLVKGSFTATLTGCTTSPTGTVEYSIAGDVVTLYIPVITGTSNTTAATLTGFPAEIRPISARSLLGTTSDNSTSVISRMSLGTDGTLTLLNGVSATFTGSGTKGINGTTFSYKL